MVKDAQPGALLPAGITDVLPPNAVHEAVVLERAMAVLASFGYGRIKPPLIEFEDSLIGGLGAAVTHQTFRLMDPVSQRMMGLRADMTPQAARIAQTRLTGAPRPLRLSYAGQVVRVKGSQMRPERQFAQVGAELIGADTENADAEIICLAAETLNELGISDLSIDLTIPTLVSAALGDMANDQTIMVQLREALNRKDAAAITELSPIIGDTVAGMLRAFLSATGPASDALVALEKLDLNDRAMLKCKILRQIMEAVVARMPSLQLTIDPVENRGFEYHTGVTFAIFAQGVRGEFGRGGRYLVQANGPAPEEVATGFSLFMDTIMRALPAAPASPARIYLPIEAGVDRARQLRAEGWSVIEGLEACEDATLEARRLECSHLADATGVRELNEQDGE